MFSNTDILEAAMCQSAIDSHCHPDDFQKTEPVIVFSQSDPRCRKYLELPFFCDLVSYGNNVVASISPTILDPISQYLNRYPAEHCFETPHLHILNRELEKSGMQVCFMAEYFLPDSNRLTALSCPYELRILESSDFSPLYTPAWENALCEKRRELDVLGIGAYHNGQLVGLAACSADCDSMWQIGIDVLPEYRRQGIASALTSRLALEILARGKIPFYCAAWSNIKSVRNAIKSGFRPAWVELTAKSRETVQRMNGEELF